MASEESPSSKSLASALVAFQGVVPTITKTQTATVQMKNGGQYSYKYADLADIWDAIRKPLKDSGLAVTQFLTSDEQGDYIITKLWHESGETEASSFVIPTGGKTPQEVGSVITYYKRYALGAALGISTEEDDDGQAGNTKPEPRQYTNASAHRAPSEKQLELIKHLAKDAGYDEAWYAQAVMSIDSSAKASATIEKLQGMKGGQA